MRPEPKFTPAEVEMIYDLYVRKENHMRYTARTMHRDQVSIRNFLFNKGWLRRSAASRKHDTPATYPGASPGPAELAEVNSKIILVGDFTAERAAQYVEWFGAHRVLWPHEVAA